MAAAPGRALSLPRQSCGEDQTDGHRLPRPHISLWPPVSAWSAPVGERDERRRPPLWLVGILRQYLTESLPRFSRHVDATGASYTDSGPLGLLRLFVPAMLFLLVVCSLQLGCFMYGLSGGYAAAVPG
jgi:hypothetical protein